MKYDNKTAHVANVFQELYNPLARLTGTEVERLMMDARHGDDVKLQAIFTQIEQRTPIYHVCIQKRVSGVLNRKWAVVPLDDKSDKSRKQAQAVQAMLEQADTRNGDGLTDALQWLVMSAFKGRTAVKAFFDENGDLFFHKLMPWNLLEYNGRFYWNPTSQSTGWFNECDGVVVPPPGLKEVPKSEICYLTTDMPIDIPGMIIYLRMMVGEDQWARFVEKEGVPQVILTAPEGTPDSDLDKWNWRALQIFEGGSGTLPHGADVNFLTEARGQDPFDKFIQHQMEQISILATGGTLMTIGGSTGLGSDLARVQQESFNSIVNQDCKKIANAMTNNVVRKCARRLGQELLCKFVFVEDDEYSASDYLDMAQKADALGIKIDSAKFKELTKLEFIADPDEQWTPEKEPSKEWSPEDKEELKKELGSEVE